MDLVTRDIETIRAVRRLCLQHEFDRALDQAKTVEDATTRNTLMFICRSFKIAQINVRAA